MVLEYFNEVTLKDGRKCCLRNGVAEDSAAVLENFILTHSQTEFLLTYPDESSFTEEQESHFLKAKSESENEIEIIATVDGIVAGTAGIEVVGKVYKLEHRAEFGISIAKEFWGLGIGRELSKACIDCARRAGYFQLELNVVSDNERAIALYKGLGFEEFGRNPAGFKTRSNGFQELVYMRLVL